MNRTDDLQQEIHHLNQWIADLQSGMYVNCVYCGHRYGPGDKMLTSIPKLGDQQLDTREAKSMAEALTMHVAACDKHPMSKLLKACQCAFHTLSSLKAVREGIPDEALQDQIDFIKAAIESAGGKI